MTEEAKNNSSVPEENEQYVVIPDHRPQGVPILIRKVDDQGRHVHRDWIYGVPPIADQLRSIARNVIGEPWRVSELAEGSVHALSAEHGEDVGESPAKRIYSYAKWFARDLKVGGKRVRDGLDVELTDQILAVLRGPYDNFEKVVQDKEFATRLEERLQVLGMDDILKMVRMIRAECEEQIPTVFGAKTLRERNNIAQQLHRGLQKAYKTFIENVRKRAA